jgi:HK97 family phage major capsid protein
MTASRVTEMLEKAKTLREDAKALLLADACTAEDMEKADQLREEADGFTARASQLKKIELAADSVLPHADERSPEGQQAGEFKTWLEYCRAVALSIKSGGRRTDPRLKVWDGVNPDSEQKDMSGQTGAGGGFLIPSQSLTELMAVAAPMSIVRPRATRLEMSGRELSFPVVDQTATAVGQPHFFGGVTVVWAEEGADIPASDSAFRQGKLTARELVGKTIVTNSLLDDAPGLAGFLGSKRGFPGAIAWAEDYAFLRGDGVGKPLGVVNAPATHAVTRTSPGTIKYDDLANMEAAFMGDAPIWIASISLKSTLLLMNGPSGNPSYIWSNATLGQPDTLLGHPIFFTDKLPPAGTKGDILLTDLSYYLCGTRQEATSIEASNQQYFGSNKTVFRIIHRVDGQPWLSAAITLSDSTTKVSPFVAVAT